MVAYFCLDMESWTLSGIHQPWFQASLVWGLSKFKPSLVQVAGGLSQVDFQVFDFLKQKDGSDFAALETGPDLQRITEWLLNIWMEAEVMCAWVTTKKIWHELFSFNEPTESTSQKLLWPSSVTCYAFHLPIIFFNLNLLT